MQILANASFWVCSQVEKNNFDIQYCCNWGVDVIKWTKDLADYYFTDWSAKINTFKIVSKCHLRLWECFYTIKHIFKANSGINYSSVAFTRMFKSYFTIPAELSY